MNITPAQAEALLYREAELLDRWKLREWADLFAADGEYLVPATDLPEGSPSKTLFLIYDDRHRLEQRAERLLKKTAHAEYPHSRTRHMVSNVQVKPLDDTATRVESNFVVYRSKGDRLDIYPGHAEYDIVMDDQGRHLIRRKLAVLDIETLRPHGKLSIIL